MSGLVPVHPEGLGPERDHPALQQRPLRQDEQQARWEVRAAQWRARELAEGIFGRVGHMAMIGLRGSGPIRGLLHLQVPFTNLETQRKREDRFLAVAGADPLLARVHLVYVVGPEPD